MTPTNKIIEKNDFEKWREEIIKYVEAKVFWWSYDNHHCIPWGVKDKIGCTKTHAYCGNELNHGIELECFQQELDALIRKLKCDIPVIPVGNRRTYGEMAEIEYAS